MTAVFAPSGNMVACGGMDNMLTIYDLNNRDSNGVAKMIREISGYEVSNILYNNHIYFLLRSDSPMLLMLRSVPLSCYRSVTQKCNIQGDPKK